MQQGNVDDNRDVRDLVEPVRRPRIRELVINPFSITTASAPTTENVIESVAAVPIFATASGSLCVAVAMLILVATTAAPQLS